MENIGDCVLYTNLLNKFYKDTIKNQPGYFLEGYITNKQQLIEIAKASEWENAYRQLSGNETFPVELRGSFCGFYFGENEDKTFFTDHIGSKALYYYHNQDKFIVSTRLEWIVKVLSDNDIRYHYNEQAAQYMLTYGFMVDDSSFISEIKRILPGSKIIITKNKVNKIQYYLPTIKKIADVSEDDAIQMIDESFRKAIKREFEKDKEYGYEHLVDLSGGLDSRMVSWVAHDLGYVAQTNFSYCKADYLDYKISSNIARDLKHEYYFKQLNDLQWIYAVEENIQLNNGAALYCGITGGKDFLANFNSEKYGIEHTGMIGDVIISCFAKNEDCAYAPPKFGLNQYSVLLKYDFPEDILGNYENQEIFDVYIRGFLGAMSTYPIRQNYFEVSSPFLDVDFMETCFSIPIKLRAGHHIYLKWINKCYKDAAKYGWEKWAGVCPKKELLFIRNCVFALRKAKRTARKLVGYKISDNMNPLDYWYDNDLIAKSFFEQYYNDNIESECFSDKLRKDITRLFTEGNVSEKIQALTVLGIAKLYFGDEG